MALSYSDYLRIDELLTLQQERSDGPEHDELLFIITHQVYELWFKQILYELDYLSALFTDGDRNRALHTLKRLEKILKTLTQQVDVLETLTPLEFNSFRDRLETASGFQSSQFRELECLLGIKQHEKVNKAFTSNSEKTKLQQRLANPSLWDSFLRLLVHNNYSLPDSALKRDVSNSVVADPEVQTLLIELYRTDPLLTEICEAMVDFDEGLQEWRYRHLKMVERTIGKQFGTGGSSGANYLRTTLFQPLWPDLWEIRAKL